MCQCITETEYLRARAGRGCSFRHSVMKMNFQLSPSRMTQFCDLFNKCPVVLFCRIKVRVNWNLARAKELTAFHLALSLSNSGFRILLFDTRQQGRSVCNRKIREKLVCLRRKQRADCEPD